MAFKIPESPNIVGGTQVLRQPQNIQGTSVVVDARVDDKTQIDAFKNLSEAFVMQRQAQENTLIEDGLDGYYKFMSDTWQNIMQEHKGKDAWDLYNRYMKPASDKYLADMFGEPKDDGKIRISNKGLQDRVRGLVNSQQKHWIATAATYGQREWDKYSETVWDSAEQEAMNMIATSTNPITMQNGIEQLYRIANDRYQDMDEGYINGKVATQASNAVKNNVENQILANNPVAAFQAMTQDKTVSSALSSEAKQDLTKKIRNNYIDVAANAYANGELSGDKQMGMLSDANIALVFGSKNTADIEDIKSQIIKKGKELTKSIQDYNKGLKDQQVNYSMGMLVAGVERGDYNLMNNALQQLGNVGETEKAALLQQKIEDYALSASSASIAADVGYDYKFFAEEFATAEKNIVDMDTESFLNEFDRRAEFVQNTDELRELAKEFGMGFFSRNVYPWSRIEGISIRESFDYENELKDRIQDVRKRIRDERQESPEYKQTVRERSVDVVVDGMVARGEISESEAIGLKKFYGDQELMKNNQPEYARLYSKVVDGTIGSLSDSDIQGLSAQQVISLTKAQSIRDAWNALSDKVKDASGTDIDGIMKKTGAMPEYSKLDIASQNNLKQNFMLMVNNYAMTHNGIMPGASQMNAFALEAQRISKTDARASLEDVLSSFDNINKDLYMAGISGVKNKKTGKDAGYKTHRDAAEAIVNKWSGHSSLTDAQKNAINTNKEYIINMIMGGSVGYTQAVNFVNSYKGYK